MIMLMTPGPTEVPERIRKAMSRPIQNPDLDDEFFEFYHELEEKIKKVYGTEKDMLVLGGEGILGLEAAVASTIKKGEKVLCLSNGIFGEGFADFVEMYGGEPDLCSTDHEQILSAEIVKEKLENNDYTAATMVHCETPTGTLNDIEEILQILSEQEVLTIVDAVSSLGGVDVPTENIDICIGGSQKCFSAPPGLTTLSVSQKAWDKVEETPQRSFYTSLQPWRSWLEDEWFPYTHLVSNLYGLDEAMDMIIEEGKKSVFYRHVESAGLCRKMGADMGLELFPKKESYCSPTVTAFKVDRSALNIQKKMKEEYDILIATSLGDYKDNMIRIGHMGYNADEDKVKKTMEVLKEAI